MACKHTIISALESTTVPETSLHFFLWQYCLGTKLVQVTQTLLTNRTGGKDRCREAAGLGRPRQSKPVALELMDMPCVPHD